MFVAKDDMTTYTRENMRGGVGAIEWLSMVPESEMPAKLRNYSICTIEKGCSIGPHTHDDETEFYYVMSGEAVTDDNGTERILRPGDITVTGKGAGHSITNVKDEPLKMFIVIVKD